VLARAAYLHEAGEGLGGTRRAMLHRANLGHQVALRL
jgi:hypothetical protein